MEEEISEIKARSDEVKPGLGEKVFKMVQGQQCKFTCTAQCSKQQKRSVCRKGHMIRMASCEVG